ncbi:MBOAT family protein [Prosthecobacter sp.]|uniref:MBOAT family protein n=1 Tax=Prosthecobacter sp. TaxID=1965333 RepID=UPI0037835EF2
MNALENSGTTRSRPGGAGLLGFALLLMLAGMMVTTLWVRMWFLAAGGYFCMKAWVLWKTRAASGDVAIWVWLCPTLNLTAFLRRRDGPAGEARRLALAGFVNFTCGAVLLWGVARQFASMPLVAGWVGMTGLILMLHLGVFHIVTAFWMRMGRAVEPLMKCPVAAESLSDFWGRRWNTAFRDAINLLVFRPVAQRWGAKEAHWLVFLVSGLLHEVVISLPAQGGWGGPTAYFLLQAAGIALGRRLRIPRGIASRLWAWVFLIAPVGLLFHPPFVHAVMLPFFQTLGALP